MPESRVERVVFVLGLVLILGLGFDVVRGLQRPAARGDAPAPASVAVAAAAVTGAPATQAAVTAPARTAATAAATSTTGAAVTVSVTLTAARGDSWMEIRAGSATGKVLYTGTLSSGATRTFRGAAIWASFGGAGKLDASLDGKPVRLPFGTYAAVFDADGFRQVPSRSS